MTASVCSALKLSCTKTSLVSKARHRLLWKASTRFHKGAARFCKQMPVTLKWNKIFHSPAFISILLLHRQSLKDKGDFTTNCYCDGEEDGINITKFSWLLMQYLVNKSLHEGHVPALKSPPKAQEYSNIIYAPPSLPVQKQEETVAAVGKKLSCPAVQKPPKLKTFRYVLSPRKSDKLLPHSEMNSQKPFCGPGEDLPSAAGSYWDGDFPQQVPRPGLQHSLHTLWALSSRYPVDIKCVQSQKRDPWAQSHRWHSPLSPNPWNKAVWEIQHWATQNFYSNSHTSAPVNQHTSPQACSSLSLSRALQGH